MISVTCIMCHKELNEPGALILSSPDNNSTVIKHHLCVDCELKVVEFVIIEGSKTPIQSKIRKVGVDWCMHREFWKHPFDSCKACNK